MFLIRLSLLLFFNVLAAQEKDVRRKKQGESKQINKIENPEKSIPEIRQTTPGSLKGYIDNNANGIDDRLGNGNRGKRTRRKRDKFIDLNGDGNCFILHSPG